MPFGMGPAGWAYTYPSAYRHYIPSPLVWPWRGYRGYGWGRRGRGYGFGRRWFARNWYSRW